MKLSKNILLATVLTMATNIATAANTLEQQLTVQVSKCTSINFEQKQTIGMQHLLNNMKVEASEKKYLDSASNEYGTIHVNLRENSTKTSRAEMLFVEKNGRKHRSILIFQNNLFTAFSGSGCDNPEDIGNIVLSAIVWPKPKLESEK